MNEENIKNIRKEISMIMKKLGMSPRITGYDYLKEAIYMAVVNKSLLKNITREIYNKIANDFDTTPTNVERNIRYIKEKALRNIDVYNYIEQLIGYNLTGNIYNSDFIAIIAEEIREHIQFQ